MLSQIRPLFYILSLLLDSLIITCSHEILKDFLRGAVGKKNAREIWNKKRCIDKILLSFIPRFMSDNDSEFHRYYRFYRVFIFSIIPQYVFLIVADSLLCIDIVTIIAYVLKLLYSLATFLFFRLPQLPHGVSRFIHKKRLK